MVSFHLWYTLTRRQRLAVELYPWLPALAGTLGFVTGAAYLVVAVSWWFLLLLLIPVIAYRGLFAFAWDIVFRARQAVEVDVEGARFGVTIDGERSWHDLDGIIQVYRSEDGATWTLLHLDHLVLTIPSEAIAPAELDYLKSFALKAAKERKVAEL